MEPMDKEEVMSLVVKATLFNSKQNDSFLNKLEEIFSPEHVIFGTDQKLIKSVREAASLAQFDYKVFDGLREIKRDLKKKKALSTLQNIMDGP